MKIEAKRISVTYRGPPEVNAIRSASLSVEDGEFLAIVGPSGSGKTSFVHVLGALTPPDSGTVMLDRIDLSAISERESNRVRASHIGFVFQEPYMISHRSAMENVAMGALYQGKTVRQRRREAIERLDQVGIGHLSRTPVVRLSGGEKQRVSIARALMGQPTLLLCDEPTGNLDAVSSARIIELLDSVRRDSGLTLVVVTHDPEVR